MILLVEIYSSLYEQINFMKGSFTEIVLQTKLAQLVFLRSFEQYLNSILVKVKYLHLFLYFFTSTP